MPNRRPVRPAVVTVALTGTAEDARRILLADWCRLIGRRLNGDGPVAGDIDRPAPGPRDADRRLITELGLPPRLVQTLVGLLAGRSEKQIAIDLGISPHTVHTYIKQLHKRMNVSSRGELLARFVADDVRGGRYRPDAACRRIATPRIR